MPKKLTFEFVQKYFKEQGCKLLETKYINSNTKMNYKCKNNHITSITWDNFKQGYRCITCSGREKLTFEFVQKYFKEQDCELLISL
jgi:ferritin